MYALAKPVLAGVSKHKADTPDSNAIEFIQLLISSSSPLHVWKMGILDRTAWNTSDYNINPDTAIII